DAVEADRGRRAHVGEPHRVVVREGRGRLGDRVRRGGQAVVRLTQVDDVRADRLDQATRLPCGRVGRGDVPACQAERQLDVDGLRLQRQHQLVVELVGDRVRLVVVHAGQLLGGRLLRVADVDGLLVDLDDVLHVAADTGLSVLRVRALEAGPVLLRLA